MKYQLDTSIHTHIPLPKQVARFKSSDTVTMTERPTSSDGTRTLSLTKHTVAGALVIIIVGLVVSVIFLYFSTSLKFPHDSFVSCNDIGATVGWIL